MNAIATADVKTQVGGLLNDPQMTRWPDTAWP